MARSFGALGTDVFELYQRGANRKQLVKEVKRKTLLEDIVEVRELVRTGKRHTVDNVLTRRLKPIPEDLQMYITAALAGVHFRPMVAVWLALIPGALTFRLYRTATAMLVDRAVSAGFKGNPVADSFADGYRDWWDAVRDVEGDLGELEYTSNTELQEACTGILDAALGDDAREAFLLALNRTIDAAKLLEMQQHVIIEYMARELRIICAENIKQLPDGKALLSAVTRS